MTRRPWRTPIPIDTTDHDQRRILRIWVGKVVDAIRNGDAPAAHDWLDAILESDVVPAADHGAALQALRKVINPSLVDHLAESDQPVAH